MALSEEAHWNELEGESIAMGKESGDGSAITSFSGQQSMSNSEGSTQASSSAKLAADVSLVVAIIVMACKAQSTGLSTSLKSSWLHLSTR